MTGKYEGSAHKDCNINFRLNKKILVIFHNLRVYDSHLIMQIIENFDVHADATPNGSKKYMVFTSSKNLVFIDSMQFMSSSLDVLELSLSLEFTGKLFEIVKRKGVYP